MHRRYLALGPWLDLLSLEIWICLEFWASCFESPGMPAYPVHRQFQHLCFCRSCGFDDGGMSGVEHSDAATVELGDQALFWVHADAVAGESLAVEGKTPH